MVWCLIKYCDKFSSRKLDGQTRTANSDQVLGRLHGVDVDVIVPTFRKCILHGKKWSLRSPNLMVEVASASETSVTLPTSIRYKYSNVNPGKSLKT
jgi:hypothetical protein